MSVLFIGRKVFIKYIEGIGIWGRGDRLAHFTRKTGAIGTLSTTLPNN